jgi:hypothetical protein
MKGKGRFLKTRAGGAYFAVVDVEVNESSDGIQAIESLGPADPANSVIILEMEPAWVRAAMRGARDIATRLARDHILTHGCRVAVKRICRTLADTSEDVVACAAGLATWQASAGNPEKRRFRCSRMAGGRSPKSQNQESMRHDGIMIRRSIK